MAKNYRITETEGAVWVLCEHVAARAETRKLGWSDGWNSFSGNGGRFQVLCCDDCLPEVSSDLAEQGIQIPDVTVMHYQRRASPHSPR